MKAIKENGLKIPEDISVIGFDDAQICNYTTPTLTTIHAPAYDMGQYGAKMCIRDRPCKYACKEGMQCSRNNDKKCNKFYKSYYI